MQRIPACSVRRIHDAGAHQRIAKLAILERKIEHLLIADYILDFSRLGLDQRGASSTIKISVLSPTAS